MFNDPVSFNGSTRVEVITVLANCGRDTDRARQALVTWIRRKQDKGRSTAHILTKLRDIESKFIRDNSLHGAFRDARAETSLPRSPDLLPPNIRREPNRQLSEFVPANMTSISTNVGHSSVFSVSSQVLDISPEHSSTSRRVSLPQGITPGSSHRSPRIMIPSKMSLQPGSDSLTTSSPEESGIYYRQRYKSDPVGPSSYFHDLSIPLSAKSPEYPYSSFSSHRQMSRSPSQRTVSNSVATSSSEESALYRHMSISPSRRRLTPPRSSPPDVPLPPIPQDMDSDNGMLDGVSPPEQPHTSDLHTSTPARPLPMQPIPSPVPGADDTSTFDGASTVDYWLESEGEPVLEDVARQDSPVFMFHSAHPSTSGTSAPPPYVDQPDTHPPSDIPTFSESLDRALKACGDSPEIRLEVAKCIEFHYGYEPPHWQTRLLAVGLNQVATKYLVDEMCRQVDWATSFGRAL